jgi:hypothetical protein
MDPREQMLVEAISSMFNNKASSLGITGEGKPDEETSHRAEFQWNIIREMFSLKCADSPFYESLVSAFTDIHSYKYLEDPTFQIALDKRLSAIGIPLAERTNAIKYIGEVIKEMGGEKFQEKEAGWPPELASIADITNKAHDRKSENTTPYSGGGAAPDREELAAK